MAVLEKLFTAEELARLPEPTDGAKYELVRGRVIQLTPAFIKHGMIQGRIYARLEPFVTDYDLGTVGTDFGFRLRREPDTVRGPDVAFVRWERFPGRLLPDAYIEGAPDLAVEVKSTDDSEPEVLAKVAEYLDAGAARVWVARHVQRTITVHWPDGTTRVYREGEVLGSEEAGFTAPGLSLAVSEVFAGV